ncbi:unnamed protein product [Amaranthus hypochondriacus]
MEDGGSPFSGSGSPENTASGSPTPISAGVVYPHSDPSNGPGELSGAVVIQGSTGSSDVPKKKRGRPRKYDENGNLNPAYSAGKKLPTPVTTTSFSRECGMKRGRGRHSVPANWLQPSPVGRTFVDAPGSDLTIYVVPVQKGEDIMAKIHAVGQQAGSGSGPRGVSVLSATGTISNVTVRQPGSPSGLLTYEGRFEILGLSGTYTMNEVNGVTTTNGGLSIAMAGPDCRVVGGIVAGWLTAADPIQMLLGTFVPFGSKTPKKRYQREYPTIGAAPIPVFPDATPTETPNQQSAPLSSEVCTSEVSQRLAQSHIEADDSIGNGHNLTGSQQSQQHRFYPDINESAPDV